MIGKMLLAATSYHVNPSMLVRISGLKPGHLLPCRLRIFSSTSVPLLSALALPQHYNLRHYHVHTPISSGPHTSFANYPRILTTTSSVIYRHSSSASPPTGGEPGWLKQRWTKFKTIIKAFVAGSKALYRDVMKMRQIQSKHKGRKMVLGQPPKDTNTGQLDFPLTREELFFITKTKKELWRMLPTVILFWIPFLGYFVPLIAFMFPHRFLTPHFLTDQQKTELTASSHQKILTKTKAFSDVLRKREDSEQLTFFYKASDMFTSGQISDEAILTPSTGNPPLKSVNKDNMKVLLDAWGMRSWIPFIAVRQRRKLASQMRYLYTSDWLMKLEGGVETLSPQALVEVCCERRLDVNLNSTEDMRKRLDIWMRITTSFEAECPEFILAHLPAAQYLQKKTI